MDTNWFIVGVVCILAIALVVFLFKRNLKDEEELETFLNNDFEIESKEDGELNDK